MQAKGKTVDLRAVSQAQKMRRPPRVVLDTNLFSQHWCSPMVGLRHCASWRDGHCVPLVSKATTAGLIRVPPYPKFKLSDEDQQELLTITAVVRPVHP